MGVLTFLQHRVGTGVGSESEVPVSADDPLPIVTIGAAGLPAGAATSANQTSQITQETAISGSTAATATNTGNVATATGAQADAAYVSGSGSIVSVLKGIFTAVTGTQAVSLASVPLPTGAATSANQTSQITQETATATAAGAPADATWSGSGSGSIIAVLKKIVAVLTGTLTVNATPTASTSGGIPNNSKLPSSANSVNATLVSAGQHQVLLIVARNTSTVSDCYLKLYNKATAPTVGTDTPVFTLCIPFSGGVALPITLGVSLFPLGLGYGLTGNPADNDATAVSLGQVVGLNIGYA